MEEVKGFKAFNNDSTNRFGKSFTEGSTHRVTGDIKFGNDGNGFHMCTHLSDVFRYVNAWEEEVIVAEVTGRGKRVYGEDNYWGYYDMYSFEEITIDRFISRREIIEKMLKASSLDVEKFLMTFKLDEKEKIMFVRKFRNDSRVLKALLYHQYGYTDIYKESENNNDYIRLVLKHGQNNS